MARHSLFESKEPETMDRQTINPEILEEMIAAEIAMKYGCYPQARETLTPLVESHPDYLPAKEALEAVYREMGEIELAEKTCKEIELVRSRLANQAAAQTTTVDGQEQIRRRIFIAGVDSIVREIYDMRDEEGVLRISALKIAESIRADRCVVVVREKDGLRARSHEYHKQGIGPSLDSRSAKLTFLISRLVSESSDPVVLVEPAKHAALAECRHVLACFNIQSILACPLIYKYDRVGMIVAHRCAEPIEWREEEAVLMSTLAGHAAVALKNAQLFREAQAADVKDELTGLHNLSFFEQRLSVELRNAQQQNYPLCLATLSINDLEALRDTEGQAFADLVLHKVGFLLKTHLRKGSVVARSAVDQFMVILPSASEPVSHHIMSQIKSVVEQNLRADSGRGVEVGVAVTEVNTSRLPSPSVVKQNVKAPLAQERRYR